MPASLTDYKGIEVVDPQPSGAGGLAIQDNFKKLIDWQYAVIDDSLTAPPGTFSVGDRYIVASPATGGWAGLDNDLVEYVDPGTGTPAWESLAPNVGFPVFVTSKQLLYYWDGSAWQPIASGTGSLAQVFDAYDAAGGQTFTSSSITVNLDTVRKNSDANVFSLASDELTISEAGTYMLIFRVSTEIGSGTVRSSSKCWLEVDTGGGFAGIVGSAGYMYNRIDTVGENTATVQLALDVAAGDKFRVRASRVNGTDTVATIANASSLSAYKFGTPGLVGTAGDPAGTDTQVQFNNAGVFGADPNFTYDSAASALQVDNVSIDGNTVSATDANGSLILSPNGNGALQADAGGDARGVHAVDLQQLRNSSGLVASGYCSTISGGAFNEADGSQSVVSGGAYNSANNFLSVVSGGIYNTASGYYSTVSGGYFNDANDRMNVVGGGYFNSSGGNYSTISGGVGNSTAIHSVVGGGAYNNAGGDSSSVSGGYFNQATALSSAVGGGYNNTASGYWSVVAGGDANTASGNNAVVTGGFANSAIGANSTIAGGRFAQADKYGQFAHASGQFALPGDAQASTLLARNSTTDATATDLFLDGSSSRLTIPTDTAWAFEAHIVAAQWDMSNIKEFSRKALIVNDQGTTSISSIDTIGTDQTIGSPGAWSVSITADNTNDALNISVTGAASTDIRWVARVTLTEVSHPF